MGDRFEIGRVWGLPVFINVWFILLVAMWGQGYFTSGNTTVLPFMSCADLMSGFDIMM